jgi:nucleoside-diphosphate-sugar epimerase
MHPADGRVIVNFITQALSNKPLTIYGDGKQTRSFCFISDMVIALVTAMEHEKTQGEVMNIGYPQEHTIKDIANIILSLTKSPSKIVYYPKKEDDPVRRRPDISKAKEIMNWRPQIALSEGLKKTIEHFSYL